MHPACALCKGACCETLALPIGDDEVMRDWLEARGQLFVRPDGRKGVRIDARCPHLSGAGACGVYENRPVLCEQYPVGGVACREAVAALRPPAAATAIYARMDD